MASKSGRHLEYASPPRIGVPTVPGTPAMPGPKAEGLAWFARGPAWQGLSLSGLPEDQRFDAFQAAYKGPFEFAKPARAPFDIHFRAREVGPLAISEAHYPPARATLKPATRQQTDPEVLFLAMYRRGSINGISGDRQVSGKAGEIHAVDFTRQLTVHLNDVHHVATYIPHRLVGYDPSRHRAHGSLAMTAGAGRILAAAFDALVQTPGDAGEESDAADAFLAVVRSVVVGRIGDDPAVRSIERARRAALRNFIEANLADPDLSVIDVCRAFSASRATIYRDFLHEGGIRNYIQARRLEQARIALAAAVPERGAVVRIAERYGFVSQPHFQTAFRNAYGTTPGAVLGSEMPSPAT